MFDDPSHRDRQSWAQLLIELDGVTLAFWLPEELDHVSEVFSTKPPPSVYSLVRKDPSESRANSHWLSRLPKKAKSKKFREAFLKYVRSEPRALKEFRRIYTE